MSNPMSNPNGESEKESEKLCSSDADTERQRNFIRPARAIADLHGLWRYCDAQACRRAKACRRDVRACLKALPLVPAEARAFLAGVSEAQAQGLRFDEAFEDLQDEWHTLLRWRDLLAGAPGPADEIPPGPQTNRPPAR